ncbi:LPS-induced tumor necrosis factor alpha factor [Metarhizium rileyi]|uniref:LPS-induced tumor necrosis factor alpha factor n=1 Tax=Metarhizium rileyi (strain RCEF 4871) TaxID=1649241 RepID=A0A167FCD7_METRR|nr:LPS-induced tumor necrosis factor alpha factor [Metarhizium rileyi RCEF 4871]
MDSQQQNVAPAQPQQAYHPVTSSDNIQPAQEPNTQHAQHALPPSYDQASQAKNAPAGQPGNMTGAPHATVCPLNQLGEQPHVVGAVLCLFCVCLACLPCLAGWFEDTVYRCSRCHNTVAVRRDNGRVDIFGPAVPTYSQYSGNQPPMNAHQPQGQADAGLVPVQNHQQSHHQQQQQQQLPHPHPQQHPDQYPMHELQPQIQQQPVTQPDAKS